MDFIKPFNRDFYSETDEFTYIGDGRLGGKAQGLANIKEKIAAHCGEWRSGGSPIIVEIPRLTVITTQFFDRFMEQNNLYEIAFSDQSDERIAYHFLKAELPPDLTGDLRALIAKVHLPLAVRSSSLLEDSLSSPFAGIYATKMIPNNQPDIDARFHKLTEAVKFVYASTFFSCAKSYIKATPHILGTEKMAVIIQEVVGNRHQDRFYPNISGVGRSYNFYPTGHAQPHDGVINLALGLGKTIVDGGAVWTFSPEYPDVTPPYNSVKDLLKETQIDFWAINMGKPPAYDPAKETEYLVKSSLKEAEYDNTLNYIASTYNFESDRIDIGTAFPGPRIINFAPILQVELLPVNRLIKSVLELCETTCNAEVEIEFALTIDAAKKKATRFGLLQVRPMAVSCEMIALDEEKMNRDPQNVLAAANNVMGNGCIANIKDILYVVPETFALKDSKDIALEIGTVNRRLVEAGKPYLLIGFGRWGSSDPWLGIPVDWGHISGSRVIIESQLPGTGASIDLSQGSHFFHNISNLGVLYFSLSKGEKFPIDWQWINHQELIYQGNFTRHVQLKSPLRVEVDGRKRKGVIFK
ncbi:MAG TPA: PEP/pyruvate-binding domain-containing protein [Candidatus Deferrimicrobium sp.]|nr:PEP/pyruvate-binding domain-containing protein [Candidatus Deferrimicrobium sp.]